MVDVIKQLNSLNKLLQRRKRNCHAVLRQHTLLVQLKAHVVGDTAGKRLIFSYLRNVSVNDVGSTSTRLWDCYYYYLLLPIYLQ